MTQLGMPIQTQCVWHHVSTTECFICNSDLNNRDVCLFFPRYFYTNNSQFIHDTVFEVISVKCACMVINKCVRKLNSSLYHLIRNQTQEPFVPFLRISAFLSQELFVGAETGRIVHILTERITNGVATQPAFFFEQ